MMTPYSQLTEREKIPLRIRTAKAFALTELKNGTSTEQMRRIMAQLVAIENYCGAEGIRRAIEDFEGKEAPGA